jgi:flavin-dependent dehydrogenase
MRVIGGGPAGTTAAIAARREGATVQLFEKARFPRHKVCGEFLSPDAALIFEKLGLLPAFLDLKPLAVRTANVVIGRSAKRWTLREPAFGISRFALDAFLAEQACAAGVEIRRETATDLTGPVVIASGRHKSARSGQRHFGFKAHFRGPVTDSIDLFFDRGMYVGINGIETGESNVCGLASQDMLQRFAFQPDALMAAMPALAERLRPLTRTMDWLITGPLVYGGDFESATADDVYTAGDALGFVDPFTGSGMLGAIATGYLAGRACAQGIPAWQHRSACRQVLLGQYRAASLFRKLVAWGIAEKLSWALPGNTLFELTRPAISRIFESPGQLLGG